MSISLKDYSGLGKPMYERVMNNKINGDQIVLCLWNTVQDDEAGGWQTPFRIYINEKEVFGFGAHHRDQLHSFFLAVEHARKYFEYHRREQDLEFDLLIQSHGLPDYQLSEIIDDREINALKAQCAADQNNKAH